MKMRKSDKKLLKCKNLYQNGCRNYRNKENKKDKRKK